MTKKILLILILSMITFPALSVTEREALDFCNTWLPALKLGERDLHVATNELMREFYTEDPELIDPNFREPLQGRVAVQSYYQLVLNKYPYWSFQVEKIYPTDNGFILHYTGQVPHHVEFFRGVDIITLKMVEGHYKIEKLVGVYDRTPFIEAEKNESTE